ncbi:MAG: adenylate kinase [Sulfolobales archaeon]
MLKVVIAVGIPGVGKSTVLNIAMKELENRGYCVRVINFGDLMLETLTRRGLVKSRDDIRNLPLSIQREVQREVAGRIGDELSRIRRLNDGKTYVVIIDTHAVVKTSTGYWSGLPAHVITNIMPDSIVVVEADVQEILKRQIKDVERRRNDYSDVELLNELLLLNRVFAVSSANLVGASVYILRNREGRAEETALEFIKLIESLRD